MSFFHKKMSQNFWVTIMPFGPVTLFYWPQHFFLGTELCVQHIFSIMINVAHCFFHDKILTVQYYVVSQGLEYHIIPKN